MRKIRRFWGMFLVLGFCAYLPVSVYAHAMWINATDYSPKVHPRHGAATKIYFGWGHHYPVDDFLTEEDLESCSMISSNGDKEKFDLGEAGFLATQLNFKKQGTYIITATLKPGFYTMYTEKGKMHHKMGPKTGLKGVILSLYYEQYAKSLINAGEVSGNLFSKPVGHNLEIITLKNPATLKNGDFLPIQVLFKGKPAKFCGVKATYSGFSTREEFAYATSTDAEGKAKIRLIHYGPWLIKAEIRLPASEELKDKCNQLHYTATLTFEVP